MKHICVPCDIQMKPDVLSHMSISKDGEEETMFVQLRARYQVCRDV